MTMCATIFPCDPGSSGLPVSLNPNDVLVAGPVYVLRLHDIAVCMPQV